MEFTILNETAPLFGDTILPRVRQEELSKQLDNMVKDWNGLVRTCDVVKEIALFCNTNEEFAYCIIVHIGYRMRSGKMTF